MQSNMRFLARQGRYNKPIQVKTGKCIPWVTGSTLVCQIWPWLLSMVGTGASQSLKFTVFAFNWRYTDHVKTWCGITHYQFTLLWQVLS